MNNKTISKIYAGKITSLTAIAEGVSNDNYLLNNKYVVRVKTNKEHFYSHKHEAEFLHKTASLNISEIVKYLDKDGNKISEYIPHTHILRKKDEEIKAAAKLLRKLHDSNARIKFKFEPFKRLSYYKAKSEIEKDFPHEEKIIKQTKALYFKYRLVNCHNDCVDNNFLFDKKRAYLIDYEYAGKNIALFDLASFISENNIKNKDKIDLFLTTYGFNKNYFEDLITMIRFENILWYYWAKERYVNTKEKIYKEIAQVKLEHIHFDINEINKTIIS